ncbi:MAG: metallophosphoesterase [Nitrososphaerota archaeon]|jgi:DNA repair exonuclease SbcCD nuclease subunit|nr:metallophosphoesterase [Nitrososphaerota archaeon]MDG6948772.1 metallophosphoesterase [Nitrososphaerota archaeon]
MKIGVISDTHVGRAIPRQIGDARRESYRAALSQAIDINIKEGTDVLIHCGDVFEKRSMTPEDSVFIKEEFHRYFKSVEANTDKPPHVFILRGNHDGSAEGNTIDYISHPMAKYVTVAAGAVDDTAVYVNDNVVIIGISFDRYLKKKVLDAADFVKKTFAANPGKLKVILVHGFIQGYHPIPKGTPEHTYTNVDDLAVLSPDLVISGHYHVPLDPLVVGKDHKTTFLNAGATEAENIGEGAEYGIHIIEGANKIRFVPLVPLQKIVNVRVDSEGAVKPVEWYVSAAKAAAEEEAQKFQAAGKDGIFRVSVDGLTGDDPFVITDLLSRAYEDLKRKNPRLIYAEIVNDVNNVVKHADPTMYASGADFASSVVEPIGMANLPDANAVISEVSAALDNRASKKTGLLTDGDRAIFVKKWADILEKAGQP